MDTVVGLSLTSASVGWVLVEGRQADGTILDHEDFEVASGGGVRAVNTSAHATAAVLDAQAAAAGYDRRHPCAGTDFEFFVIQDGSVGVAAVNEDPADRRGCQRQSKYRVQICTSIVSQCPCAAASTKPRMRWIRAQRKDRDNVVSSVYPG